LAAFHFKLWHGEDFYSDAFAVFRKKAVTSKRLLPEDVEANNAELLQALKLIEGINMLPEKLLGGTGSRPHNPLIANAFFRSGQIEAWGRGIEKIKAACAADGLPEPEFRISTSEFMICFRIRDNNKAIAERAATNGKNIVPSGTINGTINYSGDETHLLKAISDNPAITYDGLSALLGMPRRTVSREMKRLQDSGKIEREGARKNGRWIIRS
jgi:ATP-dependent DNA helicase RecG